MTLSRNLSRKHEAPNVPAWPPPNEAAGATIDAGSEQAAQLSVANAVLQRSLERLANLSDVRLLVSEVLTSIIEVAGADGGALLRYEPTTHTLVLQSYVLDGLVLDIANNERLGRRQEVMPAETFPHWKEILGATDRFFAYNDCGVRPALAELVHPHLQMNSAGLALRRGDTIIGLLILVYHPSGEIPAERILATRTLTRYAALVLELAWLADESREAAVIRAQATAAEERAAELASANAALSRSIEMLASYEDLPRFTSEILNEIIRATGASNGSVTLADETTNTLRRLAVTLDGKIVDLGADPTAQLAQPFTLHPPAWRLLHDDHAAFWIDWDTPGARPAALEDSSEEACKFTRRTGDRFLAMLPLVVNGQTIGFLTLGFQTFTEQRWPLVREICGVHMHQLSLALRSARIAEAVKATAVTEERNRLARDIHDTLTQALALIVMQLQRAESRLGTAWDVAREPLETVRQLATEGLAEARRSVTMLRPPLTPHGLAQAVREVADVQRGHYPGAIDVHVTGVPHAVERSVEEELFAIVREALTNAAKHSQARRIDIEVSYPDERSVRATVADDGVGFDPDQVRNGRYGLVGMSERAERIGAALTLASEPGAGTEIVAVWPND
ncbi:MAG TPA: GAF domain-containing sensor histidine kinase [Gemmatimonadaceae bacterium]|jgi:signal transduction histidine kinase|nr:GAF domain-containing sensor histidine kinase [Gemmatimonadaceae bacterium]